MTARRITVVAERVVVAVFCLVALASCAGTVSPGSPGHAGGSPDVVAAAAIALEAPRSEPAPDLSVGATVPAGTVALPTGAFSDRLRLRDVTITGHAVTARLDVASDVRELIDLEVRADFYDADGRFLSSNRQIFRARDAEMFHTTSGVVGLPISVPGPATGARSAVLSVPVLVNGQRA